MIKVKKLLAIILIVVMAIPLQITAVFGAADNKHEGHRQFSPKLSPTKQLSPSQKVFMSQQKVASLNYDTDPPKINSITVSPQRVQSGGQVKVSVNAVDPAGVKHLYISFIAEQNEDYYSYFGIELTQNTATGLYEGTLNVPQWMHSGVYAVDWIATEDNKGNYDIAWFWWERDQPLIDFFPNAYVVVDNSNGDFTPPIFKGLTVTDSVYNGDPITFNIDASDDYSGLESIYVTFRDEYDDLYSFSFWVEPGMQEPYIWQEIADLKPGNYTLSQIELCDYAGNWINLDSSSNLLPNISFNVKQDDVLDPSSDFSPPEIQGITTSTETLSDGSVKITVSAEVYDQSGVDYLDLGFCEPGNYNLDEAFFLGEWNNFTDYIIVPPYTPSGTYSLDYIYVADKVGNSWWGNYFNYSGYLLSEAASFELTTSDPDTVGPEVRGVTITPEVGKGRVKITVDAVDDKSGVQWVELFLADDNDNVISFFMPWTMYNQKTQKFEGYLNIDSYTYSDYYSDRYRIGLGNWRLTEMYAEDMVWNWKDDYDAASYNVQFSVTEEHLDTISPTITNTNFAGNSNLSGTPLFITATVLDTGSGVSYYGIDLRVNGKSVSYEYNPQTGLLKSAPIYGLSGGKVQVQLHVEDRSGNYARVVNASGKITGIVRDSVYQPVSGAEIFATTNNGEWAWAKSAEDGSYTLDYLVPGEYTINVWNPSYPKYQKAGVAVVEDSVTELDIVLKQFGSITGKIVDFNGQPIAGIDVSAQGSGGWASFKTGSDGLFNLTGLKPGQSVTVSTWNNQGYKDISRQVTVQEGVYSLGNIELDNPYKASISGRFINSQGQGIKGIIVNAYNWQKGHSQTAQSDDNGYFVLNNLEDAADYYLYIWNAGEYIDKPVNNYAPVKASVSQTGLGEITLVKGETITGRVSNANNEPLPNIQVSAWNGTGGYGWTKTDANGNFVMNKLLPGSDYQVQTYNQVGYIDQVLTNVSSNTQLDIQLTTGGGITGKVLDSNNNPLKRIRVYVTSNSGTLWTRADSDENGDYHIKGLKAASDYQASAYINGQLVSIGNITVIDSQDTTGMNLKPPVPQVGSFAGEGNFIKTVNNYVTPGGNISYTIGYKNNGSGAAENVVITSPIPAGTTLVEGSVTSGISFTKENNTLRFNIGKVSAGAKGTISYQVKVGAISGEGVLVNASAELTHGNETVKLGTASTEVCYITLETAQIAGDVVFFGTATPGSAITVFDGVYQIGQATTSGKFWSLKRPKTGFENGTHEFIAKANKDGKNTDSRPVSVEINNTLPSIEEIAIDAGWNGTVKSNKYTGVPSFAASELVAMPVTVTVDNAAGISGMKLNFLGKSYNMTADGNTFSGQIPQGWTGSGEQQMTVSYTYGGKTYTVLAAVITVLIDPSGYVYEGTPENRLEGVIATCEEQVDGQWVKWDAEKYGQVNPQLTDSEGKYGWVVPEGIYRVVFTKNGYETFTSENVVVPPPKTDLNIGMVNLSASIKNVTPTGNNVAINTPVTVTFTKPMDSASFTSSTFFVSDNTGSKLNGTITYDEAASRVAFTPAANYNYSDAYTVTVSNSVKTKSGVGLGKDFTWSFTTVEQEGGTDPRSGSRGGGGGSSTVETAKLLDAATGKEGVYVGSEGKKFQTINKQVFMEILKGALKTTTQVTIMPVKDTDVPKAGLPANNVIRNTKVYEFGPAGTEFTKSVKITLKYDGNLGTHDVVAPYYLNESTMTWEVVGNAAIDKVNKTVTFEVNHFSKYTVMVAKNFADIRNHWAEADIELMIGKGVISGYNENEFRPNNKITRAEFVTLLVKALGIEVTTPANGSFKDVASDSWYYANVETASKLGIVKGYQGNFNPNNPITRQEMAAMIVQAMGLTNEASSLSADEVKSLMKFKDEGSVSGWARKPVAMAVKRGILKGFADQKLVPGDNATRAQAVVMLTKMLASVGK